MPSRSRRSPKPRLFGVGSGSSRTSPPTLSAASTSRAFWTSPAPSRSRLWVPTDRGENTLPGTAITSLCRSSAASAVIKAPDPSAASTTITTSDSAAIVKLRAGKLCPRARSGGSGGDILQPEAERLEHVVLLDLLRPVDIGGGAGHPPGAVKSASGHAALRRPALQRVPRRRRQAGQLSQA